MEEAEPQLEDGAGGAYVHAGSPGEEVSELLTWQLHVKSENGGLTTIEIEPEASCAEAKEQIARTEGTPVELMRLSLSVVGPGDVPPVELSEMFSLRECGVKDGSVILLSRKEAASPLQRGGGERMAESGVAHWLARSPTSPGFRPEPEPEPVDGGGGGGARADLWRLLQQARLLDTLANGQPIDAALASLGVEEVGDISVLEPEDFESIGVTAAQQQTLLSHLAEFQESPPESAPVAPQQHQLHQRDRGMDASASARMTQRSAPQQRHHRGGSDSGYTSPTSSTSSRSAYGSRNRSPTVAVEKFVARQRAWNGMRKRNLEEKKREVMIEEGALQPTRRLTRAEVADFADRQMEAVELRDIRRELLKEEVVYNERGGAAWQHDGYVDVGTFAARQEERRLEAKLRLAEKAAALEAENRASFAGVPIVNDSSTKLAQKYYAPLVSASSKENSSADGHQGGAHGTDPASTAAASGKGTQQAAGSLTQAIGADVFQRLSSPMRQRSHSANAGSNSRSGRRAPQVSAWSDTDNEDSDVPDLAPAPDNRTGGVSAKRTASSPSGSHRRRGVDRRSVTGGRSQSRPRARSAQRAPPMRAASPDLHRGSSHGRQWRSMSAQRHRDPHLFRERLQQYGRYANRLNTGIETGGPSAHDASARIALIQQAEQERRLRRAKSAADRRRVVETGRQRRRSGWGPPPPTSSSASRASSSPPGRSWSGKSSSRERRLEQDRDGRRSRRPPPPTSPREHGSKEENRLAEQLQVVQAQLLELQSSHQAGREEVREQLQQKTREAADLRAELERVHTRMLEVERFGGSDAGSSIMNFSSASGTGMVDQLDRSPGSTLSTSRLSFTADGQVDVSSELLELIKEIGLPHAEQCLAELGVSLVSDLEYVTDSELEHSGLRPVQWRKLRTAAAQYLGLEDAGDGVIDEATRRERRRQFLAATASPRSPLASSRTGSGGSVGSEKEGSPTAAARQRQQEIIPTKSLEKRRSASPPVRLPPQVVPVVTRSPEERSPQSDRDERGTQDGLTTARRTRQQRRPPPPPKQNDSGPTNELREYEREVAAERGTSGSGAGGTSSPSLYDVGDFDTEWDAAEPTNSSMPQATTTTDGNGGDGPGDDFEAEWAAAEATPSAQAHSAVGQSANNGSGGDQPVSIAVGNTMSARRRPPPPPLSTAQAKATEEAQHLGRIEAAENALRLERLAREEAEQTLQAEREVMLAVQQMQQQQTVQRARAHVDAQRATAEAMSEAEAAARLLSRSGMHLSESAAVAEAAGAASRAVMERGSDTWRKLGQEILSLETNIDYIESMLLPEVDGGQDGGQEGDVALAGGGGSQR